MITKEEIKELEGNYFEVLQTGAFAITLKSKNTGHYWHLLEREFFHSAFSCLSFTT